MLGSKQILKYLYVYVAILMSGNIFLVSINSIKNIVIFGAIVIVVFILVGEKDKLLEFEKDQIFFITFLVMGLMMCALFNPGMGSNYIHWLFRIIIALLFTRTIKFSEFKKIYLNLMIIVAIASVFFWAIGLIYPTFVNVFNDVYVPSYEGNTSVYVNVFYIYTYIVPLGYGSELAWSYGRNTGPFWEPGAFQFYLVLALVFLLEKDDDTEKNIFFKVIILSIAIASTGSSTGLISLIVCFIVYRKKMAENVLSNKYNFMLVIVALLIVLFILFAGDSILAITINKIMNEFSSNSGANSVWERTGLQNINIFLESGLFSILFGLGENATSIIGNTADNTYISMLLQYGMIVTFFFLIQLAKQYRQLLKCNIGAFVLLMFGFSSEVLFSMPIVLFFLFWKNDVYSDDLVHAARQL